MERYRWYVERGANLALYAEIAAYARDLAIVLFPRRRPEMISVLEVGCSYPFLLDILRHISGFYVTGIDPSPIAKQGAEDLKIEVAPDYLLPERFDTQFDMILAVQVLEHAHDPAGLLKTAANLLKPDGVLVMTTPDAGDADRFTEYDPGQHSLMHSRDSLTEILASNGLHHARFFTPGLDHLMGCLARKKPFPGDFDRGASPLGLERAKAVVVEYIRWRLETDGLSPTLRLGLSSQLFTTLVNEGRYREALKMSADIESLIRESEGESVDILVERLRDEVTELSDAERYAAAMHCFLPPYLFFKGMLDLNYRRDHRDALAAFGAARAFFEHEVRVLRLAQFQPLLDASRNHEVLCGNHVHVDRAWEQRRLNKQPVNVTAAPLFMKGPAAVAEIPVSGLRWISAGTGESVEFEFTSLHENLTGLGFGLAVSGIPGVDSVECTLDVCAENGSVTVRTSHKRVTTQIPTGRRRTSAPFLFETIPGARGQTDILEEIRALREDHSRRARTNFQDPPPRGTGRRSAENKLRIGTWSGDAHQFQGPQRYSPVHHSVP